MDEAVRTKLRPFEKHFHTSLHLGYANILTSDLKKILSIYYNVPEDKLSTVVNQSTFTCGRCKMNALKMVANEYFNEDQKSSPSKP